jgi:ketosteroid isomerase-like protein
MAFGLAVLACATGCAATHSSGSAAERAELLAVREEVWRAWFENDPRTLEHLLGDDFLAIDAEGGLAPGREGQILGAASFAQAGGKLIDVRFPVTEIQWFDDVAVVYTTYEVDFTMQGEPQRMAGRATEIFARRGGRWVHPGWHVDMVTPTEP